MNLLTNLSGFPWKRVALNLKERFKGDQLALTASSLTFTTIIALVPFITVALAVFTAFPMFSTLQTGLQKWLVESLVPDNISRQVLGYLTQFSGQASKLGAVGVAVLFGTALALILTIDRTLNRIWRVPKARPLQQRVLIYWAVVTLGPLLLAASLAMTSYVISSGSGLVGGPPGALRWLLGLLEFALISAGAMALFRFVPNTHVAWAHAWAGGIFVAAGIQLAKKLLTLYLSAIPSYSAVYGAFATVPILLVWIYLAWLIVLTGAVLAAWWPSINLGASRAPTANGWHFQLALEVLQQLRLSGGPGGAGGTGGATKTKLAKSMRVDLADLEPALHALLRLDWLGQLDEVITDGEPRLVLLVETDRMPLAKLVELLLMARTPATESLCHDGLSVKSALRNLSTV
jgi:membrane protein